MPIYVLTVDNNHDLKRVLRLFEKHNIEYYVIIFTFIPNDKSHVFGGIVSQYSIQRIKLEQILFILARHNSNRA